MVVFGYLFHAHQGGKVSLSLPRELVPSRCLRLLSETSLSAFWYMTAIQKQMTGGRLRLKMHNY